MVNDGLDGLIITLSQGPLTTLNFETVFFPQMEKSLNSPLGRSQGVC